MKTLLLLAVALAPLLAARQTAPPMADTLQRNVAAVLMQEQEPPPHPPELPEGHYCVPTKQATRPELHPCACVRHCVDTNGGPDEPPYIVQEDQHCAQWCHKSRCACPTDCE